MPAVASSRWPGLCSAPQASPPVAGGSLPVLTRPGIGHRIVAWRSGARRRAATRQAYSSGAARRYGATARDLGLNSRPPKMDRHFFGRRHGPSGIIGDSTRGHGQRDAPGRGPEPPPGRTGRSATAPPGASVLAFVEEAAVNLRRNIALIELGSRQHTGYALRRFLRSASKSAGVRAVACSLETRRTARDELGSDFATPLYRRRGPRLRRTP